MSYDPLKLGLRLRRYREAAGLSQTEVARRSGISQRTISRIEAGELQDPGFIDVLSIASVYALTANTIAAWAGLGDW